MPWHVAQYQALDIREKDNEICRISFQIGFKSWAYCDMDYLCLVEHRHDDDVRVSALVSRETSREMAVTAKNNLNIFMELRPSNLRVECETDESDRLMSVSSVVKSVQRTAFISDPLIVSFGWDACLRCPQR